ncbi:hypothetical protein B296_00036460 [Ensete ventricosum]|uniref:Uncharacterized protein n=1 Tax=Ensete ventricosum TaxID=4639 RepID=A0A426X5D8_ENSVE|nr:hypothetical protein B296_00036460 [Ensete ventricosum]
MCPQVRVSTLPVSGRPYDRWGFGLTCARSVVRPLAPPYLRPTSFLRRVSHVGGPVVQGREDVVARSSFAISFFPPWEDLLEVPDEGAEDERELRNLNAAGADPTEQELRSLNGARADPTEQELGNWNGVGADPTEQELGNLNDARADPIEHELGNWNGAGADPTE